MWESRTKDDLIVEVWEKLDCENIGATEIEAIEVVIEKQYGRAAVDSPMIIARLLADEGAELRHSEIMELYLKRSANRPYDAAIRNILHIGDFPNTLATIRNLENLRKKYRADNDKEGLRLLRETAQSGKRHASGITENPKNEDKVRKINLEISNWLSIWLQTPELFNDWVELRQNSPDFVERFGRILKY